MTVVKVEAFYNKLSEMQKEEKTLRHEQANRFQQLISTMEEKFEKRFDKLENLISQGLQKADETFATKIEHSYNSDRIGKLETIIGKIAWTIVLGVICVTGSTVFVVIMMAGEKF